MRSLVSAIAVLCVALPLSAQRFEERVDVNAVLLDVIVTDARGNQILGLDKSDFVVTENGVVQTVDSVDYFTSRTLLTAREGKAPFQVEKVREDRYFVFFFDKPHDPSALFGQLTQARLSVTEFLRKQMRETDRVAIVGHDVRLKVYSDFTNDRQQLEAALNDAVRFGPGVTRAASSDEPSILGAINRDAMIDSTGTVYSALDFLARSLRPINARKNLVLFSPGILEHNEIVRNGIIVDRSRNLDPALESLNGANVAVYSVQLQRDPPSTPVFHQRLSEIADATGGHYFQFNSTFRPALQRIDRTNSGYYLVTYRASHPRGERGFQKVEVSVRNREFRISARPGYQYGM